MLTCRAAFLARSDLIDTEDDETQQNSCVVRGTQPLSVAAIMQIETEPGDRVAKAVANCAQVSADCNLSMRDTNQQGVRINFRRMDLSAFNNYRPRHAIKRRRPAPPGRRPGGKGSAVLGPAF
jgi:hypothetical protein